MLKQLSTNVLLIEASEKMFGYAKVRKDLVKKRFFSLEDNAKF